MTALKPIENRRVQGIASERYPLNEKCSHPECNEPVADPHHCFPRSEIGNDSWFVRIYGGLDPEHDDGSIWNAPVLPHVAGLCRAHHDAVEAHRAWIKLQDAGFVWYDRKEINEADPWEDASSNELFHTWFTKVGPLNPQPGSREGKPKRRKYQGEKRRKRKTISMRVPDDHEDGAGMFEDLSKRVEALIGHDEPRPVWFTCIDAFNYVLLNEGSEEVE